MKPLKLALVFATVWTGVVLAEDADKSKDSAKKLPPAEKIIAQYIEATGGEAAHRKITSHKITAKMEFPSQGIKGQISAYSKAPAYTRAMVTMPGLGRSMEGSDGKIAWEMDNVSGARVLEGDALEFRLRLSRFYAELEWKQQYKSAKTVDEVEVDGKKCYKIELTPKSGDPVYHYYDKDSHLRVRADMTFVLPQGKLPVETYLSEYKEFGGIKVATKNIRKIMGQEQVVEILSYETNVEIPEGTFDTPEPVKEAIKMMKEGDDEPAAPEPKE